MVSYHCYRCNYKTHRRSDFKYHLNRKYPCKTLFSKVSISEIKIKFGFLKNVNKNVNVFDEKVNVLTEKVNILTEKVNNLKKHICNYCEKKFSSRQGKYQHQKKYCKMKNQQLVKSEEKPLTQNITLNNNGTINNTTNNIIINNYGKEDTSYITDKYIKQIMEKNISRSIPFLIKNIHFNPDHPENHNIAITNKKSKYGSIRKDDIWQLILIKDMLNNLIEDKLDIIADTYMKFKKSLPIIKRKTYEKYMENVECDEEKIKKYLEEGFTLC